MILGLGNTIPSDSVRQGLGGGGGGGFDNTYSLAFDGVDDYLKASLDGTSTGGVLPASDSDIELTISFWFYMDGSQSLKGIFQWGNSLIDTTPTLLVNTDGASIRTFVDGSYRHTSGITMNAWHHYAITRTASTNTWQGYIDGVSAFTANDGGTLNDRASAIDFYFGVGYNGYLNGKIDEASFWNSVQDVATIYNSGEPNDLTSLNPTLWLRNGDNGSYKSPQWLIPENSNKDKVSNYSFEFDGVDDYISFSSITLSAEFTISAWIKPTNLGSNTSHIISTGTSNSNRIGIYTADTLQIKLGGSNVYLSESGGNDFVQDVWQHVLIVRDNSNNITAFRNGASFGTSVSNSNTGTLDSIFRFNNTRYSSGNLDEVAIWNSDQSANVASIYNSGVPTTITGATAYWKMGEEANFTDNWLVNNSALTNYSTRSFNFDGVDDEINCGDVLHNDGQTSMTVSAWVNVSTDGDYPIAGKKKVRSAPLYAMNGWDVTLDTSGVSKNKLAFQLIGVNSSGVLIGSIRAQANGFSFNDGLWHHVVVTYDGSEDASGVKFYRDGVEDTNVQILTNTLSGNSVNDPSVDFKIASRPKYSGSSFYNGSMDELAIWSTTALTQEQITTIYNSGTPARIEGATSYWRMGEDATFNTNWNVPDNIGSATGTSANMIIADLEGDAPNYTGGGLSANMTIEDRVGDAPNSTSNALSYNMTESDRETDVPT
jgi:hypothetical protein